MITNIFLVCLGLGILTYGANFLVKGSVALADIFKISPLIVGLTIVAFGTSTPELFVSISAALKGNGDISLGNVVGSNIFNLLGILGVSAIFYPIIIKPVVAWRDMPIMLGVSILLLLVAYDQQISRLEGVFLTLGIIAYIIAAYFLAKKENHEPEVEQSVNWSIPISILAIIGGLVLLIFGGSLTVDYAILLAKELGVSDLVIGVTIVAVGTSLPELVTSFIAAKRGQSDLALGNVVGSNIYNILSIIGISSLIAPIKVSNIAFKFDIPFMLVTSFLCWFLMLWRKKLTRIEAVIFFLLYLVYVFFQLNPIVK